MPEVKGATGWRGPCELLDINKSGNTAMHYALAKGNKAIIKALLSTEGINVDIFNNAGQKPIAVLLEGVLRCEGKDKQ